MEKSNNKIITIICSIDLFDLKLDCLAGEKAEIIEKTEKGCWVKLLRKPFEINPLLGNHSEWFIPFNSILKSI